MGFAGVVCYSSVAYMGDLWGPNIIFFHGAQNLLVAPLVATCTNFVKQSHFFFVHDDAGLKFVEEEKSWIYALEHCYGIKSSLVQITNSTVRKAVKSLLKSKTELQKGVWIGLERSIFGRPDRPWKWISGCVAKDNAPPWNSSLVDPLNNHCGKIIRDEKSQELKLLDSDCHDKLPFICQGKLNCFP